jgi:hypothetical protein
MLTWFCALAAAEEPAPADKVVAPEVLVGVGPGFGGGEGGTVGASAGVIGVWFPTNRVGVQALVREGYWAADPRFVGQIGFAPRWRASRSVDAWLGFVHHHETPIAVVEDNPVGSIAGVAEGIHHRSGADLAVSYGFPLEQPGKTQAVGRFDLSTSIFPDAGGPLIYGQLWLTLSLEVAELRRGG